MKKGLLTVSFLTVLMIFTGCADETIVNQHKEYKEISFSWWGNDSRHEYTLEAIREFEELNPDIKVNCHYSEWSGYNSRMDLKMASNTESDVMQINYAWIQDYSPDGTRFYDLNQLKDYIDLSNFSEKELSYGMQNGILNAIPIALNTQTVYINKDIYDKYNAEIPESWDDLFRASELMNGEAYPLSMAAKAGLFAIVSYTEEKTGKIFIDNNGVLNFNEKDIQIMLDFYVELVDKKVMPQVEYFEKLNIASGEYAGTLAWLSDAANHCQKAIDNGYDIQITDYLSNTGTLYWYTKPATLYAISNNTEYPEESARLLDFLLNSKEMALLQKTDKGIPLSRSALSYLEENNMLLGLEYNAFLKMSENSEKMTLISPYMEDAELLEEFKNSCNNVLYEKNSSEDEAKLLYKKFKEILS